MSLADHLRELRYRVVVSVIVITLVAIVAAFWYDALYQLLMRPYLIALNLLAESNPSLDVRAVLSGVATPLTLALQIIVVAALVVASPFWLYQLWAFIVPALLANEKKYALIFLATALPLFLLGVLVGYFVLPQAISVLLSFTPESVPLTNLLDVNDFLSLTLKLMLVFGIGFLMPVVVVGLNLVGVVSAAQLGKARSYVIFGTFVFAAAATPSTDPFSMLALALPMTLLYLAAEVVSRINDRRRNRPDQLATSQEGV